MGIEALRLPDDAHAPTTIDMAMKLFPFVLKYEEYDHAAEWKRHQVYARGLKLFPDRPRDDVALAIELAVKRMKGKPSWQ